MLLRTLVNIDKNLSLNNLGSFGRIVSNHLKKITSYCIFASIIYTTSCVAFISSNLLPLHYYALNVYIVFEGTRQNV